MISPDNFEINEAWIVFQLNAAPIQTEKDGNFNCIAVMDAASCLILGSELIAAGAVEISQLDSLRLLSIAKKQNLAIPSRMLVQESLVASTFCQEASRKGVQVSRPSEHELSPFIGEAKAGFERYRLALPK